MLITQNLVELGSKKYHITASSQEINNALQNFEEQNGITTSSELQQALSENGMTLSELQNNLRIKVLEGKLAERNVSVTSAEIQTYYNQNKSKFESIIREIDSTQRSTIGDC